MTAEAELRPCARCRAATTRELCGRCELEAERAKAVAFVSPLTAPGSWFPCPKCGAQWSAEVIGQCWTCDKAEERTKVREAALARSGLLGWHAEVEADHPVAMALFSAKSPQALRARLAKALHTRTPVPTITITGAAGAGKSTLAALLMKERLAGSLFVRSLKLAKAESHHGLGNDEAPLIRRAKEARVLVIDELKVPAIAFQKDMLEELIWDRVDAGLLTIVTHGFTEDEYARDWGKGAHRRQYADGQHIHLVCPACGHDVHKGPCAGSGCGCARRIEIPT